MPKPCRSRSQNLIDFGVCRCQAFSLTGNATITDPVCSLSPHHIIIEQPIIEAEKESQRKWMYQNENESRRLTIRHYLIIYK